VRKFGPEAWPGLDPGASNGGGQIVAAGTPEQIAATKGSYTGQFLKPVLARSAASKRKKQVEAAE
jgi:excinuclease ABC subunit A